MAIDMNRLAAAALEAALEDEQPRKRRGSGLRAIAAGAAIVTAARVALKKSDHHLPLRARVLADALRVRFGDHHVLDHEDAGEEFEGDDEDQDFEDEEDDEEPPADEGEEAPEAEAEEEDEPEAEGEDEPEAEGEDEPEAEGEDEPEDEEEGEPEAESDDGTGDQESTPDLLGLLSTRRQRPLVLGRARRRLDPAARPPEPPGGEQEDEQATAGRR